MRNPNSPYRWYAVYTHSRAEKKLHSLIEEKGIECYLPLKKELRQWKSRKKWVEQPLISSYLFVRVSNREFYEVLNSPGAVCYVSFEGKAAEIPQKQIDSLKAIMDQANQSVELSRENIASGDMVEVLVGPLKGVTGEVSQIRGQDRIVLRFESLGCNVLVDVDLKEVKRLTTLQTA